MKKLHTKKLTLSHITIRTLDQIAAGDGIPTIGCGQLGWSVKAVCCSRLASGCTGGAL